MFTTAQKRCENPGVVGVLALPSKNSSDTLGTTRFSVCSGPVGRSRTLRWSIKYELLDGGIVTNIMDGQLVSKCWMVGCLPIVWMVNMYNSS